VIHFWESGHSSVGSSCKVGIISDLLLLLLLLLLLRWLYSPMRTFASLMDFSQSSPIDLTVSRPYLGFPNCWLCPGWGRSPTPNPQSEGPGLHIYVPWRVCGPVIPPGTEYRFNRLLRHEWATVGLFFSPVTTRGKWPLRTKIKLWIQRLLCLPRNMKFHWNHSNIFGD
jgi:hypothetical protein